MTAKENLMAVYLHKTPEWLPDGFTDKNFMLPMHFIERYDGMEAGTDEFGVHWTYEEESCAPMPTPGMHLLDDVTLWKEKVNIPDLDCYDWELNAKRALSVSDPNKLNYAMNINGMFERLHACMGMTDALCALIEEEDACYDFFGAIADHKIGMMERSKKYYLTDVFNMHDDYGTNDRPFMSLDLWRRLLKPHLKRVVEACHDFGMIYQQHSCGFIEPFVDDLVEIGIDAMDTWQVCNTNMRSIKDKYQDCLTFIGGVDNQGILDNEDATEEEIYQEFKRAIDLMAPGGSYIPFPITLKMDFMPTYFKVMNEYGKDFYIREAKNNK